MILDFIIVIVFILAAFFGFKEGFIRSVVGFTSTAISLIVSIALAKPLALGLDKLFGLVSKLGGNANNEGVFDNIVSNKGLLILTLICAVILFIVFKIVFFFLRQLVSKWKETGGNGNRVDNIGGAVLGILKIFVYICIIFGILSILSNIGFIEKFTNWLLNGSHLAKGLYKLAGIIFIPIVKTIGTSIGGLK